jgi:2'-hydroxyisoflavone reductase
MKLLMLGGGVFLGRALAREALSKGWELTCLTRGHQKPGPVEGVAWVQGDRHRAEDLRPLASQDWDAIVDTCAYRPADLEAALDLLGERCGAYLLVSTISVYQEPMSPRGTEESPLLPPVDPHAELAEHYGALKAMCEDMVQEELEDRALVVRPGLIVGPEDPSERFAWWVRELDACAREGRSPRWPDAGQQPFQWLDVRDLASFCLHVLEEGAEGAVHVAGPDPALPLMEVWQRMAACLAPGLDPIVQSADQWRKAGIRPWSECPLWLPEHSHNTFDLDTRAARDAGWIQRSLEETTLDTLAWVREAAPAGRGQGLSQLAARLDSCGS